MKWIFIVLLFSFFARCRPDYQQFEVNELLSGLGDRDFKLSKKGTYFSFVRNGQGGKRAIFVKKISEAVDDNPILINDTVGEARIKNYFWLSDSSLVYVVTNNSEGVTFIKKNIFEKTITQSNRVSVFQKYSVLSNSKDGNHIYLTSNLLDSIYSDVYDLDLNTQQLSLHIKNFGNVYRWIPDYNGEIKAAIVMTDFYKEVWFRKEQDSSFKKEFHFDAGSFFNPYFDANNPRRVYALQNAFSDVSTVISYDLDKHQMIETEFSHAHFDVSKVDFLGQTGKIAGLVYEDLFQVHYPFSVAYQKMDAEVKDYFKDEGVSYDLVNSSEDGNFKIIFAQTDRYPGGYFLYDGNKNSLQLLANINAHFPFKNDKNLGKLDTLSFINQKGYLVQGYMTLTPYKEKAPVMVLLHTGLNTRDTYGYDGVRQFFVNRGFHVFQVNYSGSSGYGKSFKEMGNKQIGKNIYDDIIQGLQVVSKRYQINQSKILIYGRGLAGCIALQATTMPNQPFKAAIVNTASLNLFSYIKGVALYNKTALPAIYCQVGNPLKDVAYLKSVSPVFNVNKIEVPVLIGYNLSDRISGTNENLSFVRLMQAANKEIYFFGAKSKKEVFDMDTYEISFFENVDNFLSRLK